MNLRHRQEQADRLTRRFRRAGITFWTVHAAGNDGHRFEIRESDDWARNHLGYTWGEASAEVDRLIEWWQQQGCPQSRGKGAGRDKPREEGD